MKSILKAVVVGIAVLAFSHSLKAEPRHLTNAVAVADFDMSAVTPGTKDWAFGLADVLAVELQQRDVILFERQQIRVVLGERQISASGLMQLEKMPGQEIPDLPYLVTGTIHSIAKDRFHLESSLVEARTGRNVASFANDGQYPKDLANALTAQAGQIATRLKSLPNLAATVAAAPTVVPAAARTPEVSLLFYKGIAYCLAGQPELGVTWFMDAESAAPTFLPARVWIMRAYEMLGLSDFAAVARARVSEAPNGQGVLNRLNDSRFFDQKMVSVAIIADPRLDGSGLQLAAALKTAMGHYTNLFVADPSNIRALAAEMDLQLTEQGARDLELTTVLWSSMDALILLGPGANTDSDSLLVELRDALSGEVLWRHRVGLKASDPAKLGRDLAQQIFARRNRLSPEHRFEALAVSAADAPPTYKNNTDREEFARYLKYIAGHRADRPTLVQFAWFAKWLDPVEFGRSEERYQKVIADRIIAATDVNVKEPDTAHWLSTALWHGNRRDKSPGSLAVDGAVLLERFPNSPEAQYLRSALALELVNQQKYAEALALFLKLTKELPELGNDVKIGPEYWANLYFFTAMSLHNTGDDARTRQFLSQADEILRQNPDMVIYDGDTYQLGVWVNHFPVSHPLFGTDRNLRQAVAEWRERLDPASQAGGKESITLPQLESMLAAIRQASGPAAEVQCLNFLRRLVEHQQLHSDQYQGRITDPDTREPWRQIRLWNATTAGNYSLLGKLMVEAPGVVQQALSDAATSAQCEEVRGLGHALAEPLAPHIAAGFYSALGEYEMALQKVEEAMGHPSPYPDTPSGRIYIPIKRAANAANLRREKIHLLQAMGKNSQAADYALSQVPLEDEKPHWERVDPGSANTATYLTDANGKLYACRDAADALITAGHPDLACRLFADYAKACGSAEQMDAHAAAVRLNWADYEIARGNRFDAAEILREVAKQSEGKDWGVYLRTGYANAYNAAVSRLASLRAYTQFQIISTDWEHPTKPSSKSGETSQSDMERDLAELLRGTSTGPNQRSYGGSQIGVFISKYGHNALPLVLETASHGDFSAQLIAQFGILQQIATSADAPQVLEAFKTSPQIAQTAFQLDSTTAAVILRERFGIYGHGGNIPPELLKALEKNQLKDQYPVLVANFAAKEINGATAPNAAAVDRILRHDPDPEALKQFRSALASTIEKELLMGYRYGFAAIGETALRNGVPEGIEALLRGDDEKSTGGLDCLRKYLELPMDNPAARSAVESGLGRWRWDSHAKKFILGIGPDSKPVAESSTNSRAGSKPAKN